MGDNFHDKPFDDETILKLEIFRSYIKQWLPVFLSRDNSFRNVAIYDFFAGPGKDTNGVKGTPLIIVEEMKRYLEDNAKPHAQRVKVSLYFNDDEKDKYLELINVIEEERVTDLFSIENENKDFSKAFNGKYPAIAAPHTANLVILDQSGIKHVTEDVFKSLIDCRTTDILFFISSAIIRRFAGEQSVTRYFPGIPKEKINGLEAGQIHRFVCEYYRDLVPNEKEYYLAPFSIKKNMNVYGILFGSNSLRGLEKFLDVCWKHDPKTGEANYNIDKDVAWEGDTLFSECNTIQKRDDFQSRLIAKLKKESMTNKQLYRYCLENGFLPKHANEILSALRKKGRLTVLPQNSRGFYINWECYSGKNNKIVNITVK